MQKPKDKNENAKADAWKVPVDLPHVTPKDYPDADKSAPRSKQ